MESTTIAQQIREFIAETFFLGDGDPLRNSDSFLERGIIDSTGILELIGFLQNQFDIRVEDEEAVPDNLDSVDKIVAYLGRKHDTSLVTAGCQAGESL